LEINVVLSSFAEVIVMGFLLRFDHDVFRRSGMELKGTILHWDSKKRLSGRSCSIL
jgi:hypothetical protein